MLTARDFCLILDNFQKKITGSQKTASGSQEVVSKVFLSEDKKVEVMALTHRKIV
jgi:hypothetical protein